MSGFPLFSDHGPRASTEATFTPGGHEPQTALEQWPSETIGNFYRDRQASFPGEACIREGAFKWITNENHQKRGNRPLKACARRLPGKKRKTRARRGTIWPRALIASKNAPRVPMEEAHKKN